MTAALALPLDSRMTIASDLFGPLSVDPEAILTFPRGVLGFPEARTFVLLPTEREHVYWLQSASYASLVFLVVDPFVSFPGYTVDLATTELARASLRADQVTVLAIVTLPGEPGGDSTANLQGPIVIDTRHREGHQVILADSRYGIKEPLSL